MASKPLVEQHELVLEQCPEAIACFERVRRSRGDDFEIVYLNEAARNDDQLFDAPGRYLSERMAGERGLTLSLLLHEALDVPACAGGRLVGALGFVVHAVRVVSVHERCIATFRDVSREERAWAGLREAESRFRSVTEQSPLPIWGTDEEGRCTFMSPAWRAYTGQSIEASLGGGWLETVHADDRDRVLACVRDAGRKREAFEIEARLRRPDGSYHWVIDKGAPRYESGTFRGYVGSVLDINDRKEREVAVREFLAMLGHELRNPLAPVRAAVAALKRTSLATPRAMDLLEIVERQSEQLTRLVDDLLDISRIAHGKIELRKELVEAGNVVRSAVETVRPLLEAKGHELEVHVTAEPLMIEVDPARLAQVIANLLNNAAKYTDSGGHLVLDVDAEGEDLLIRVSDDGCGISPSLLPRMFDLFTQGPEADERGLGGLGVGLTLVKRLVQMHRGRVEGFSNAPRRGSTFVVRLPVVRTSMVMRVARGAREELPALSKGDGSHHRILVVDDNEDAAESLAVFLSIEGHETERAHTGQAAIARARAFHPDLVLLDIGLPDMDGYDVAKLMRADPSLEGMRIVALTGYGQAEDRARAHQAGFDAHLTKPVAPEALLAAMSA